ncbi:TPA: hypothetical protein U2I49_002378 [Citrobacter koseri]|nr:hypothetical protein [Citrobacter koseri]HEM6880086.1 hypothetical protein [Citrobacter koseri]HEM8005355.1 hypothetical protein [Citrobacter koseri]
MDKISLINEFSQTVERLDSEYRKAIDVYISDSRTKNGDLIDEKGSALFSYLESWCVSCNSSIDMNELSEHIAEVCLDFMDTIIEHNILMRDIYDNDSYSPSKTAYAFSQRTVKKYFPNEAKEIREKFKTNKITTYGFDSMTKINKAKVVLSCAMLLVTVLLCSIALVFPGKYNLPFLLGVGFLFILFLALLFIPHPTSHQHDGLRTFLSLAVSGVVTTFPGFIEFTYTNKMGYSITACGSLAIFLIIYLINPAKLRDQLDRSSTQSKG